MSPQPAQKFSFDSPGGRVQSSSMPRPNAAVEPNGRCFQSGRTDLSVAAYCSVERGAAMACCSVERGTVACEPGANVLVGIESIHLALPP
jgi:hypothetical protein